MAAATAAAAVDKPGNEQSFSPVHIYQEVVGYTKPKNEKGRAGSSAPRPPFLPGSGHLLLPGVREWKPVSAIEEIVSANLPIERTLLESAFCWGPF